MEYELRDMKMRTSAVTCPQSSSVQYQASWVRRNFGWRTDMWPWAILSDGPIFWAVKLGGGSIWAETFKNVRQTTCLKWKWVAWAVFVKMSPFGRSKPQDAFSKVTEFNGVSREEFMQIVDLYDERRRVHINHLSQQSYDLSQKSKVGIHHHASCYQAYWVAYCTWWYSSMILFTLQGSSRHPPASRNFQSDGFARQRESFEEKFISCDADGSGQCPGFRLWSATAKKFHSPTRQTMS